MDPADRKPRATYQDIVDAPENQVAEIVGGVLHLSPRPAGPHTRVASTLGIDLGGPFDRGRGGPGGWIILDEPELQLHDDVLVPDLAGWRRERLPIIPEKFGVPPDWICEVLSKSTERLDRAEKMQVYADNGVEYAWLVSPRLRTLEAFRLIDGRWTIIGVYQQNDRARIEPFDAIEIELATLWEDFPLRASEPRAEYELDW